MSKGEIVKHSKHIFLVAALVLSINALAKDLPAYCVRQHFATLQKEDSARGFTPSEAELMVAEVARSISFQQNIKVIYCNEVSSALAWPSNGEKDIPDGDYIAVNPRWLREVIGDDRVQAITLLGHELGHYLGRHFESRKDVPREQQEAEADAFAGCAVARLSGDLQKLENLLSRLRTEAGGEGYPKRTTSLEAARQGFKDCGGGKISPHRAVLRVAARPDTVSISVKGFMPVDYDFKESKGVDVQIESEDTQWLFLDGNPISPIERFGRILGGTLPVSAHGSETYHNNIYLPDAIAKAARARGYDAVQLKHIFNCRDQNENMLQVQAIVRIYIQKS